MPDPFSLVPLAMAAHGGTVDGLEAQQLVAAGLTLLQRSATLVRALSGKRSAILLPTSPAFLVALAASDGRGAVLVNPLASPSEISYQLSDANVGAVFTLAALADRVPPGLPRALLDDAPRHAIVLDGTSRREIDLGSHAGLTIEGDAGVAGSDEEAVVVYTSAMAGRPLGAVLTHRNLIANARSVLTAVGYRADDRVLALLPYSHLFGLSVTAIAPLLTGAAVVTVPRFSAARAAELLASGEITQLVGVPGVYRALLAALERREERLPLEKLRVCVCGGSPLNIELQARWFDCTGVELRQGYGLTEAGPVCLFNRIDRPNVRGTLGTAFPGVEVELHEAVRYDESGTPLSSSPAERARDVGEICVRGENVSRGYVGDARGGLPIRDGWLHTGDLGTRSADGSITFNGLVKPMFTRNGFNIYPHEIENAVRELAGVTGAHAFEIVTDDREPEIGLDVRGAVAEPEVKAWCAERLSAYKQPSIIRIL